jgi:hypothetical protein
MVMFFLSGSYSISSRGEKASSVISQTAAIRAPASIATRFLVIAFFLPTPCTVD